LVWHITIYKIGYCYYKAIAFHQNRKYKGYYKEYKVGGFYQLLGILPIPYMGKELEDSKSTEFMNKRKKYVIKFYSIFFGFMLFLQFIKWEFSVNL